MLFRSKVAVPAGTYFVKTFVPPELGFISAKGEQVTIADGQTITLNLKLRRADAQITGLVFLEGGTAVSESFVWGWSPEGGYQETISQANGSYVLNVISSSTWKVAASKEIGGALYEAAETSFFVASTSVVYNITLERIGEFPLPTLKTADASRPVAVSAPSGASVVAPANSIAGGGAVTVSITPDARAPSQGDVAVIGIAYSIEIRDASGQEVSSFRAPITLSLPYKEEDVEVKGAEEEALAIGFWDETKGTWRRLENCVVNKEENNVTCKTTHLTRFALVAPADATPPSTPTDVSLKRGKAGEIVIAWVNPSSDFGHAKIYRSEKKGELGELVANNLKKSTFSDQDNIVDGTTYYYTVRAVDPAGNESTNADQISIVAKGSSGAKAKAAPLPATIPPGQATKAVILNNLKVGSTGDDVKTLQQLLLDEGVYPQGLISGFFGELTKQAVIRFQEKYADEILMPAGLEKGNGFVGPATRKKIGERLGATKQVEATTTAILSPGQATKAGILRNLTAGDSGDDVKTLQEFLLKEGVYPEGLITGYFGSLTKKAVTIFQEKYTSEILAPAGLGNGTGFVGPSTRKKINEALSR